MQFSKEHDDFRAMLREFVAQEIEPYVDQWEAAGKAPLHELFKKLGDLGVLGLEFDPEYGGQGADHLYMMIASEELGRCGSGGVSMAIGVQMMMATPSLQRYGTHELKKKYLEPALRGDVVTSIAVTEPDAGSDVASLKTRAVKDGDHWVINGSKIFITNGTQADWMCLLARTSDEGGYHGMSQIIIDTDAEGFSVARKLDKLGMRSSDTAELRFEDMRIPISNTIGEEGRGFQQQMSQFVVERMFACYGKVGSMQDALDRTRDYLRVRVVNGKPLIANQYIAYKLTELSAQVDLLRVYNLKMAEDYMAGKDTTRQATIGKLQVGRLSRQVADMCLQYHGGLGYMEENWTSRFFRDGRLTSIGGGADEVMLQVLSKIDGFTP